jgi:chromosome segregation ATPase
MWEENMETSAAPQGAVPDRVSPVSGTEIVFDAASGISLEEQGEILAGLDALPGKGRLELAPESLRASAKKRGFLFPLLINGGGLVVLAAGFLLLSLFHDQAEPRIRGGEAALGITERRLIQEIRRETAREISEKERDISAMLAKLAGVDAELQELQEAAERMLGDRERELRGIMEREIAAERERLLAQNLSEAAITERMRAFDAERITRLDAELASYRQQLEAERRNSQSTLQKHQEEYRAALAALQAERAQILEASRIREANQRAQMEERIGELSGTVERSRADLAAVREELQRLSSEQDRARLAEGQLAGYYAEVQNRIGAGEIAEAGKTLAAMREFLDTPSFKAIRALQARRDLYLAAIAALEGMIAAGSSRERSAPVPASPAAGSDDETLGALRTQIAALEAQNTALEQTVREQEGLITQGSSQGRQLVELQATLTSLRQEGVQKDQAITGLREEIRVQTRTLAERDSSIAGLQSQNAALETQNAAQARTLAERESALTGLRQESAAKDQTITGLRQEGAAKDQTITGLRQEGATKDQQISTLNQNLETIRAALQALSQ